MICFSAPDVSFFPGVCGFELLAAGQWLTGAEPEWVPLNTHAAARRQ